MQRTLQRSRQRTGRGRDAETAREAILCAAQEIFARDGFSGARVDDIAHQSGYNKALTLPLSIRTSTNPILRATR
jgi:DNA-binding transcriptional regulator YbjK